MGDTVTINLRHVARGSGVPLRQVQAVVELLDEGNTVPFITRYRKDQTGGLDEVQIRQIQTRLTRTRLLAERKQTILRSIESQGKLTEKLAKQIHGAGTTKRLEDLYLPYKPKKQTLATLARARGLEPLANEILAAAPSCADLDSRAGDYVSTDRQVPTPADALLGAGHVLAEQFSERAELRQRLREILQHGGRLVSSQIGGEHKPKQPNALSPDPTAEPAAEPTQESSLSPAEQPSASTPEEIVDPPAPAAVGPQVEQVTEQREQDTGQKVQESADGKAEPRPKQAKTQRKLNKRELQKKKAEERKQKAFSDYFDYSEEIKKIPPHRVLAINRGERAKVLRVKIESDTEAMIKALDEICVPPDHPHGEFLRGCARDALTRLILSSLEREIRRELTERAENHAVEVFARNLRNLLLQSPVRDRRVLAVDPGFTSGCKLAALDQFGNMLEHGVIYLVGQQKRRQESGEKVVDMIRRFQLSVVTIGNGTACREAEAFFSELISNELKDDGVCYVIVNEAGASVYSTSPLGREEFPQYDASLRGAISIGRRLQDPLSELVKIDPANIGVGLYQHDVKAKHLRASLDEVVESCVNYVGVDVNTASPALLRYVSGLNQLTARRLYEHRHQHGPFRNREQFKEVTGFGAATFVQAAGFLKINTGDNPLDSTWIHPESYETAAGVLGRLDCTADDLTDKAAIARLGERTRSVEADKLAEEFTVGALLLSDILTQLARPGRDPREDLPAPIFKRGVLKLEDLNPGMELAGTVLNVVDFGAFVDIGMHDSGLVHVSQLADKYIRDPHDVIAVGDIVKVWVVGVEKQRRRVSLTMIPPGTERTARSRGAKPRGRPAPDGAAEEAKEKKPRAKRPPRSAGKPPGKPKQSPGSRPKPTVPITEGMKTGKEPMRTFGDLVQFFETKETSGDDGNAKTEQQKPKDEETQSASP